MRALSVPERVASHSGTPTARIRTCFLTQCAEGGGGRRCPQQALSRPMMLVPAVPPRTSPLRPMR
jgi:hypothetical protein